GRTKADATAPAASPTPVPSPDEIVASATARSTENAVATSPTPPIRPEQTTGRLSGSNAAPQADAPRDSAWPRGIEEVSTAPSPEQRSPTPSASPTAPAASMAQPVVGDAAASTMAASADAAPEMSLAGRSEPSAASVRLDQAAPSTPSGAPSTPPPAVQQTIAALYKMPDGDVELRLDPPELGRVRVSLSTTEAGLVATVLADRPEVADMMRRHADALLRSLEESGHERVDLRFSSGGDAEGNRDERQASGDGAASFGQSAVASVEETRLRNPVDGVDLRV
ncbi:MAG: flagellar hook-length control protein FliK, partial [Pseudomonadota bacterium]